MSFSLSVKDQIAYLNFNCRLSVNLLYEKNLQMLIDHLDQIEKDPKILGSILFSQKTDFCYGAHIQYLQTLQKDKALYPTLKRLHETLLSFKKPRVSIVQGKCLGGGLELILLSSYRIGIQHTHLTFGCPEVSLGIIPGLGATQRLPRIIGLQNSMKLLLNQTQFDEISAMKTHLIHDLTEKDTAFKKAIQYLKKPYDLPTTPYNPHQGQKLEYAYITALTKGKTQGNYPHIQYLLQAIYEGSHLPLKQGLSLEAQYFTKTLSLPYLDSLLKLHIHRQSIRKQYRSNNIPKFGIIGGGFMGSAITKLALSQNIPTILIDLPEKLETLTLSHPLLKTSSKLEDLKGCDIVLESIPEDLNLKRKTLQSLEPYLSQDSLILSNTSALSIQSLSQGLSNPKRCLGFHFLSPVDKMPIIEIIHHDKTASIYLKKALTFSILLNKTPIQVKDTPRFYTTNIVMNYLISALTLYTQGIDPILIENASKQLGMKTSPFILLDEIGIDIAYSILQSSKVSPNILKLVQDLYQKKHLGRKTLRGFYHYPEKRWALFNPYPKKHLPFLDIQHHILNAIFKTPQTLEASEHISTLDAQLGLLGLGLPPQYLVRYSQVLSS